MDIGEKISKELALKKMQKKELATLANIPLSTLSDILNGKTKKLDIQKAKNICRVLEISLDYLLDDNCCVKQNPMQTILTPHENNLIKKYRSLDSYGKEIIDSVLDLELKRYEDFLRDVNKEINSYKHETGIIQLPYFDLPVSAGSGVFLDSDTYEILDVPDTAASRQATYAVRVSGDSMEPDFQNGDKILVRQQLTLEIGDLGIFILNGEGYFKEYGGDCLISLNKAYEPVKILADDSIYIKGKVIGKL